MYDEGMGVIPFERWYQAIGRRRSRRRFDGHPLSDVNAEQLAAACESFRPFPDARVVLVSHSADLVLKGAVGTYGKIKGARAFFALLGNMETRQVQERAGYICEGMVLEATALGLDTCWVAGLFRPDVAARLAGAEPGERVLAVVPVGRAFQDWSFEERLMTGFGRVHKRKPLTELVKETREDQLPDWARTAVEAARLAPSAVNRQPWRFRFATETITVSEDNAKLTHAISKRLDCGIAMLHVEAGAMHAGVSGRWEFLQSPDVGRFVRIQ